jgi:hypothetical protein
MTIGGIIPAVLRMGVVDKMNKLLGILKYISPARNTGGNPKKVSMRMEQLRKVGRRMKAMSQPAGSLDPVISQKLEQAKKE